MIALTRERRKDMAWVNAMTYVETARVFRSYRGSEGLAEKIKEKAIRKIERFLGFIGNNSEGDNQRLSNSLLEGYYKLIREINFERGMAA